MPETLTDALVIMNAACLPAGGLTTGVRPDAGSAKIEIEEMLTLMLKLATVTCSAYVSPSSITTHDMPAAGVPGMAFTAAQ